jgi:EEF1A lysine methyltransferase 4
MSQPCVSHDPSHDVEEAGSPGGSEVIPKRNCDYASRSYWETRFSAEEEYEWLLSYERLRHQIDPLLFDSPPSLGATSTFAVRETPTAQASMPRVLVVGCGNSPFSADLYDGGCRNILNIDYSKKVIAKMKHVHSEARPEMEWRVMDMTDLNELGAETFDFVFDKAAMDTLLTNEGDVWNPNPSSVAAARAMCQHISRVLKPGGHFAQVSLVQPHFRSKYLLGQHCSTQPRSSTANYSDEFRWTLQVQEAGANKPSEDGIPIGSTFGYFLYVMTKDRRE